MRNISLNKRSLLTVMCAAAVFTAVSIGGLKLLPKHASAAITTCGTGYNLVVPTYASGVQDITIGVPTSMTPTIREMIVKIKPVSDTTESMLGEAIQSTTTLSSWGIKWATGLQTNGSYQVSVEAVRTDSTVCLVGMVASIVQNTNQSTITTTANTPSWSGPLNYTFPITLNTHTTVPDFDVTPYTHYVWNTSIGSVDQGNHSNTALFTTGQTAGSGEIMVDVFYGGQMRTIKIPVTVGSTTTPLPSSGGGTTTSGSGSATNTTQTTTGNTAQTTSTAPAATTTSLQDNPAAQTCVVTVLGETRYADINTGAVRPTTNETDKYRACFASSNYILPSNFAPVAPTDVKKLTETKEAVIDGLKNVTTQTEDGKKLGLKLQGKAKPNSLVFVYIYSDPLVLTTTADAEGNWEYTLQNPIEPGKHEVYTVVDRGDGTYERSRPLSFLIGTATAAEANPNGLSLQLADASTPSESNHGLVLYVAATTIAIIAFLLVLLFLVRKHDAAQVVKNEMLNTNGIPVQQDVPPVVSDGQDTNRDDETQQGL